MRPTKKIFFTLLTLLFATAVWVSYSFYFEPPAFDYFTVHCSIFNRKGEIYLQKRSRWKDRHPGQWDSSAAGHVNAGEQYDDAARRELHEELGITAAMERILKLPASQRTGQEFIWLYRARHDGPFQLARSEIEAGEFFPPQIISAWIDAHPEEFAPGFVECWRAFRQDRQ